MKLRALSKENGSVMCEYTIPDNIDILHQILRVLVTSFDDSDLSIS